MSNIPKRGTNDDPSNTSSKESPAPGSGPETQSQSQSQSEQHPPPSSSSPSLASRIQSSASGLARNAFYSTSASAETAHLLSSNDKASSATGPGSSSPSALAAAQQYKQQTSAPKTSSHDGLAQQPGESFRSTQPETSGGFTLPPLTEDEFQQQSHVDPFSPNEYLATNLSDKGKGTAAPPPAAEATTFFSSAFSNPHSQSQSQPTTYQPSPTDGTAVLTLLNSATFDPEFPPSANEPFEPIETELQLTPSEIEMLESFRRQLQSQPRQLTSHSLVPDIGSVLDSAATGVASDATTLRDTVVSSLPGAADWVAVEERYHDEVWGYLQPTLEAAKKEIEEKSQETRGSEEEEEDGPAVRRLKMILKHMQA
ncbi:hypothetical protein FE257_006512 [Aspergillus nanangensis]|uniref:Uncharacterized protein n=1 Tax=Aspergillus nanangensis TaxID=2582783 RepID=A0AAD4CXQ0_ASPNN|nr:hypothetical protein FE257_006512 [Aspergillus nanangensis]